jgi:DNA-directed RNA polymerase specialized sigma24 family protein
MDYNRRLPGPSLMTSDPDRGKRRCRSVAATPLFGELLEDLAARAEVDLDAVLTASVVRSAVASLPEGQRRAVVEFDLRDRPMQDIADETGVSISAVSHVRASALRRLAMSTELREIATW